MASLLLHLSGPLAKDFIQGISTLIESITWMPLGMCWLAALALSVGGQRVRLLDIRNTLESLDASNSSQVESLMCEPSRQQGYALMETGVGGVGGGIELVLLKEGCQALPQCKQWKCQQVGISVAREMHGLPAYNNAYAIKIVCVGTYIKRLISVLKASPSC
ncbi:hypothetical protein FHY16_000154 [Xanthomonas campestris]|uniref:restriction endonuclease n=1 Tax=Xanthomonas euroxanthea TaxID=2259622 RepID=UPI0016228D3C|nr:restriction endonuclease [Xanthomonas euroxanthea]MBB3777433.1 hypothetical protein [Xanthomonas euroxanthea]